jgi:hypothetical protein
MSDKQGMLFPDDFLDRLVGTRILKNSRNAVVELVANAWDAGATEVKIDWPNRSADRCFRIEDNGHGMTEGQFRKRWRTVYYNRIKEQGDTAEFPEGTDLPSRPTYGRNGLGRFAGFCFGESYHVQTTRDGESCIFKVFRGSTQNQPFAVELVNKDEDQEGHGTTIYTDEPRMTQLAPDEARKEIGMRFLTDPNFSVSVDGVRVTFAHIPEHHITEEEIVVPDLGVIKLIVIDTLQTDRTALQHGLAWQVRNRLVGECSWKGLGREALIDGRTIAAKRYIFVAKADVLADEVLPDWTGFQPESEKAKKVRESVNDKVREILLSVSEEDRKETFQRTQRANREKLERLSPQGADKWKQFVRNVQENCPSIKDRDLIQLAGILANLEETNSQYGLIHKLGDCDPEQLDSLHEVLSEWDIESAKIVLDEIKTRLLLLDELQKKVVDKATDEVGELQPLFKRGLWIFGPEFETIEYTSNQGMTRVVQDLFKSEENGSRNRPDFAVLPDGSAGLYSLPRYDDDDGSEIGVSRLVIIELKKPTVAIGTEQKAQCWKYVKELYRKGLLDDGAKVRCFALGPRIDPEEVDATDHKDGRVRIQPMTYDTVVNRAKSRLLNLSDKVRNAPFLSDEERHELDEYMQGVVPTESQDQLDLEPDAAANE